MKLATPKTLSNFLVSIGNMYSLPLIERDFVAVVAEHAVASAS